MVRSFAEGGAQREKPSFGEYAPSKEGFIFFKNNSLTYFNVVVFTDELTLNHKSVFVYAVT
jgi:hypothetical protein